MTDRPKIIKVCAICGSDDVLADAFAYWDVDAQQWELENVFTDKGPWCNTCEDMCRIKNKDT